MQYIVESEFLNQYEDQNPSDDFVYYGTKPKMKKDEEYKKRKPMTVEDQIVTDSKGRRRFHGAFTGGFSAGFYNTCGSEEGWNPATFHSSRNSRIPGSSQYKPEDFMDEEDMLEHGIAPLQVRATNTFQPLTNKSTSSKQNALNVSENDQFFERQFNVVPDKSMGYKLLRMMGWKEGRGVGEKIAIKLKNHKSANDDNDSQKKVYGCEIPDHLKKPQTSLPSENVIWISPQEAKSVIPERKSNLFGLGYIDLRKISQFLREGDSYRNSRSSEFKPTGTESKGIRGKAFGIGALEDEDIFDEIYQEDKLTDYDFGITDRNSEDEEDDQLLNRTDSLNSKLRASKYSKFKKLPSIDSEKDTKTSCQYNYLMKLPNNFRPTPVLGSGFEGKSNRKPHKDLDFISKALIIGDISIQDAASMSANKNIPPSSMETSRKPSVSTLNKLEFKLDLKSRFVSSGSRIMDVSTLVNESQDADADDQSKAAQMDMFGPLTRTVEPWQPESMLCRRFDVRCPVVHELKDDVFSEFPPSKFDHREGSKNRRNNTGNSQFRLAHQPLNIHGPLSHLNESSTSLEKIETPVVSLADQNVLSSEFTPEEDTERDFDLFADVFGENSDDDNEISSTVNSHGDSKKRSYNNSENILSENQSSSKKICR